MYSTPTMYSTRVFPRQLVSEAGRLCVRVRGAHSRGALWRLLRDARATSPRVGPRARGPREQGAGVPLPSVLVCRAHEVDDDGRRHSPRRAQRPSEQLHGVCKRPRATLWCAACWHRRDASSRCFHEEESRTGGSDCSSDRSARQDGLGHFHSKVARPTGLAAEAEAGGES